MLPTFIVAGAAKSGTTAIYEYLKTHPQVCMAWMKEPNFFTQEGRQAGYRLGLDWYQNLFQTCKSFGAVGDVSPALMTRLDSPGLIYQIVPQVQLLFILRDPGERIYSQYRYALHRGRKLPDFEEMVRTRHPDLVALIKGSAYDQHLGRFLDYFAPEKVSVFIYEDWRSEPKAFIQSIYRSIGVDPDFSPPNLGQRYNPSQQARIPWIQRTVGRLAPIIMKTRLPQGMFALLRNARQTLWRLNSIDVSVPVLTADLRRELAQELSATIDFVEDYIGRPLPAWRK